VGVVGRIALAYWRCRTRAGWIMAGVTGLLCRALTGAGCVAGSYCGRSAGLLGLELAAWLRCSWFDRNADSQRQKEAHSWPCGCKMKDETKMAHVLDKEFQKQVKRANCCGYGRRICSGPGRTRAQVCAFQERIEELGTSIGTGGQEQPVPVTITHDKKLQLYAGFTRWEPSCGEQSAP